jgi:hypothetical protein
MFSHPVSAIEARTNAAVKAPRLSLLAIEAFVSSHVAQDGKAARELGIDRDYARRARSPGFARFYFRFLIRRPKFRRFRSRRRGRLS